MLWVDNVSMCFVCISMSVIRGNLHMSIVFLRMTVCNIGKNAFHKIHVPTYLIDIILYLAIIDKCMQDDEIVNAFGVFRIHRLKIYI